MCLFEFRWCEKELGLRTVFHGSLSGLDVTYVSDINNNCIHYYKGWEYEGVWHIKTESLLHPRYILCINDVKHDNRHGMLLLVLDQVWPLKRFFCVCENKTPLQQLPFFLKKKKS